MSEIFQRSHQNQMGLRVWLLLSHWLLWIHKPSYTHDTLTCREFCSYWLLNAARLTTKTVIFKLIWLLWLIHECWFVCVPVNVKHVWTVGLQCTNILNIIISQIYIYIKKSPAKCWRNRCSWLWCKTICSTLRFPDTFIIGLY